MADYMAQRIIDGALDYTAVVSKYSSLKTAIDTYISAHGRTDLIK